MRRDWIVAAVALALVAGWVVFRNDSGHGSADYLFDNHVTQVRLDSQRRVEEQGRTVMTVPPHVQPVGIPAPGMTGELVFPRSGGGYLETGKRAGSFGDTVPVELTSVMPVRELTQRGKIIYDRHCACCHGEDGQGKGPVALYQGYPAILPFDDRKFERYPLGKIFASAAFGQGNMPAFGTALTVDEMWQAALWVRYLYGASSSVFPGGGDGRSTKADGIVQDEEGGLSR